MVAALGLCARGATARARRREGGIHPAAGTTTWTTCLTAPMRQLRSERRGPPSPPQPPAATAAAAADTRADKGDAAGSDATNGDVPLSLRLTLEAHSCAVVDAVVTTGVDVHVTLANLLADSAGKELGDFRLVLLGLLVTFAEEVEVLESARRCLTSDVHDAVERKMLVTTRGSGQRRVDVVHPHAP